MALSENARRTFRFKIMQTIQDQTIQATVQKKILQTFNAIAVEITGHFVPRSVVEVSYLVFCFHWRVNVTKALIFLNDHVLNCIEIFAMLQQKKRYHAEQNVRIIPAKA